MNNFIANSYIVLELKSGASLEEIKSAYHDLVRVWHPDRFNHDRALQHKAQEKLKEINAAYDALIAFVGDKPKLNAEQNGQNARTQFRGLQIDKYVYQETFCIEIAAPSKLTNSNLGKPRPTVEWMKIISDFGKKYRAVEYVLSGAADFNGETGIITRTDFALRKIFLNLSAEINLKAVLIPMGLFCIRDKLNGILKNDRGRVHKALKSAGWRSGQLFMSEDYFRAELLLSNCACEHFLDRTMNSSKKSGWSIYWKEVGSAFRMNNLDDSGVWLGYCMQNEQVDGYSFRVGK